MTTSTTKGADIALSERGTWRECRLFITLEGSEIKVSITGPKSGVIFLGYVAWPRGRAPCLALADFAESILAMLKEATDAN